MKEHPFQSFVREFETVLAKKTRQYNLAFWILETTGSKDAADLKAELDMEVRFLFNDRKVYEQLLRWDGEEMAPLLKRQLNVLIRTFKQNMAPKEMLAELARREADLGQTYATFRPMLDGKPVSENEIKEILKNETSVQKRKTAWEASKAIGPVLAPQILELVKLRNKVAKSLGYGDYFQMQLDLQEVDAKWLLETLDRIGQKSESAYEKVLSEIRAALNTKDLDPWLWSEPFCQEDPLDNQQLDRLVDGVDLAKASIGFYQKMNVDVAPILERSDNVERPGKNQHAFCINIDREGDVRTLNNIRPTIKWMETVLHELGHAIYEIGFDPKLPWLLREPPHMITTEAMALLAGRQAYRVASLPDLTGRKENFTKVERSLARRQLIFCRWVLTMTEFESEMYRNPDQDLNALWWRLVEKHQKIRAPNRPGASDWACKYHIGLAPVYYFSYLLGEMFASDIQKSLGNKLAVPKAGQFLREKLFGPGNSMPWPELIKHVTDHPLTGDAWLREFC
jgi:peptidyl-dipeptidase A